MPAPDRVAAERELGTWWHAVLHRKGWIAPAWPKEHGGCGWDVVQRHIWEEECALANAPQLFVSGLQLCGPVLMAFGRRRRRNASCRRCSRANTTGARASRSRARGPISPRSRPVRCATATTTSSTGPRSGRRTRTTPTGSSSSRGPPRKAARNRASASSCRRWMRRASRCGRSSRCRASTRSTRSSSTACASCREPRGQRESGMGDRALPARERARRQLRRSRPRPFDRGAHDCRNARPDHGDPAVGQPHHPPPLRGTRHPRHAQSWTEKRVVAGLASGRGTGNMMASILKLHARKCSRLRPNWPSTCLANWRSPISTRHSHPGATHRRSPRLRDARHGSLPETTAPARSTGAPTRSSARSLPAPARGAPGMTRGRGTAPIPTPTSRG